MSYSVCINCEKMVPAYEKYCGTRLDRYPQLKQVSEFWRYNTYSMEAAKELARQELAS